MAVTIHVGDCREVLRTLAENSVDSVVTDPPYELGFMGKGWDASGVAYDVDVWREALRVLKPGGHLLAFGGSRTSHRMVCAIEDAGFDIRDTILWLYGSGFPKSKNLDGDWEGWGTALKPAHEPITIARKPLVGTVSANVLAYGTGALNIDGCRVGDTVETWPSSRSYSLREPGAPSKGTQATGCAPPGRWPANVIHDGSEEVLAGFPFVSSGQPTGIKAGVQGNAFGVFAGGIPVTGFGDSGSAARFFYCAKPSRAERNDGCDGLPLKPSGMISNTSGQHMTRRDGGAPAPAANNHPTVKPTELMRYLCRLVTPPGGVVLDPFMGSGSTGRGAVAEGFRFIGIELNPDYAEIARRRIAVVQPGLPLVLGG